MKVHLIKKQSILLFAKSHARSRGAFAEWLEKISFADWMHPSDIKKTFATADFLGKSSNRIVFDIVGNNFRIICKYVFWRNQCSFICMLDRNT
jgi:mRNA interferase HigB